MMPALPASKPQNAMETRVPPSAGDGEGVGEAAGVAGADSEGATVEEGEAEAPALREGVGDAVIGAPSPRMNTLSTRKVEEVAPSPARRQQKPAAPLAAGKLAVKPAWGNAVSGARVLAGRVALYVTPPSTLKDHSAEVGPPLVLPTHTSAPQERLVRPTPLAQKSSHMSGRSTAAQNEPPTGFTKKLPVEVDVVNTVAQYATLHSPEPLEGAYDWGSVFVAAATPRSNVKFAINSPAPPTAGEGVCEAVPECEGVCEAVPELERVPEHEGVGERVDVSEGVAEGVPEGVPVAEGVPEGVLVAEAPADGEALTVLDAENGTTPLIATLSTRSVEPVAL
jgi:hypothetical protein